MKQSKDPFEAAFEESPLESPVDVKPEPGAEPENHNSTSMVVQLQPTHPHTHEEEKDIHCKRATTSNAATCTAKNKDEDEEEEEEDNMNVELAKFPSAGDPNKMAKIPNLSQLTEQQMSRHESVLRARFQKANMKRLLASITGTQKISMPITIVISGIAKLFVGDVVETARIVMEERKESGPIQPCHLREAHRRLKREGKVFKRSSSRLF